MASVGARGLHITLSDQRRRVRRVATRCVSDAKGGKKSAVYVGKGKYVQDDIKKYPGRSEDNMAGGWAGGEKGLWQFREELGEKGAKKESEKPKKKVASNVNLDKEFGNMVGGFPGGEVGLKLFVKTGEVPKTRPATVGPIGGSLGILVPTYALVALLTGEPDPRVWVAAVGELVPETQAAAPSSGLKLSLPPVEASTILPAAPYIALGSGVVAGGLAVKALASSVLDVAARSVRVGAVGAVAVAVAGKILSLW